MIRFIRFVKDEGGASAAEYALIVGIIGSGIAFAAFALGESIANGIGNTSSCIQTGGGDTCQG